VPTGPLTTPFHCDVHRIVGITESEGKKRRLIARSTKYQLLRLP